MIILDENILATQRSQLRKWRFHHRQIGHDIGRKGIQDDEIIPLLRMLSRPTFVTWDSDYFDQTRCNDGYCLVFMDVRSAEVATYLRRLLRHPDFRTWAQRKGCVIRVAASGISTWRIRLPQIRRHRWTYKR